MVTVHIGAALICFANACYPTLVGPKTPLGEFNLTQRLTASPGYGGDVLQFKETDKVVFAIHRVWALVPSQQREARLQSADPARRSITNGCVNVDPIVYEKLMACCVDGTLSIVP
jgi:hypothetical protein